MEISIAESSRPFQFMAPGKAVHEFEKLKVRDIMVKEEMRIYELDSLEQVKQIMEWEGIFHCCVIDENEKLVGMIDLESIKKLERHKGLEGLMAADICHRPTHVLLGSMDAQRGVLTVVGDRYHSCPVFENGKVIGILNIEEVYPAQMFH